MTMVGRIVGIIGGLLTFVGALLPWATVESALISPQTQTFMGAATGIGGILVLIFGIIGLILVATGKRGPAIGGIILGVLALIFALLAWVGLAAWAEVFGGLGSTLTTEYGIYISLVGSIILIIGSALAMGEAKKAEVPMAPPMAAPMEPPIEPTMEHTMEEPPEPPMGE
ncbi:MAG: hypothetical protein ACE5IJ_06015 [Thermoplasmata archaeon]